MIHSMAEIFHVAHKAMDEIFNGPVVIQEKVDGSQFSFRMTEDLELQMRSKGQELLWDAPSSSMFKPAMEAVQDRAMLLIPGTIYRGEFLAKPKHNSLAYDRIPKDHVVLFEIETGLGSFGTTQQLQSAAHHLGFDVVPVLFEGQWREPLADLTRFFDTESYLGGQKIEGIVVKNYAQFLHGKPLLAKLVSDKFKEVHAKEWKQSNPGGKDIIEILIECYAVEARWAKSVQHLRDEGKLTNSPVDIGPLLKEVSADIRKEEEDIIKETLFQWAWPKISRGVSRGFPEWYKQQILEED